MIANIDAMQELANQRGVALRPHVKTHKCLEIAQLQLERGAVGLTASKVDEALPFIQAGAKSLTVAYPIVDSRKLDRLLAAAKNRGTDLRVVADSEPGMEALSAAAMRADFLVGIFLEIDVGLGRCGIAEDDERLVPLVQSFSANPRLRLRGLFSHAGHAYGAANRHEIARIAAEECAILHRVHRKLESAGVALPEVSVGSTPTVLASETFSGITEIRPGNYVFMDRTPVRQGLVRPERVALTVLTTVVSANENHLIIDAGSKTLSSDRGAHGSGEGFGFGAAFELNGDLSQGLTISRLSEEHGFVERGGRDISIGTKLRVFPNHACPVVNLADKLLIASGDVVVDRWPVVARGIR